MPPAHRSFLLLAAVLGLCAGPIASAQKPPSVEEVLGPIRQRSGVPGLAAAVVQDGKILAVGTLGVRELGKAEALTLADPFLVGSCTKPMTRLLLARLSARTELRPEKTLAELLPGVSMREEYRRATLADVLRHTAGLPAYTRITPQLTPGFFALTGTPREQRTKFVAQFLQEPPAGKIGDFVYSNAGYALIGHLLEQATGLDWEELMRKELFQPLALGGAAIGLPDRVPVPKGHRRGPRGFELAIGGPPATGVLSPAGGVGLPIEDFARYAIAEAEAQAGVDGTFLPAGAAAGLAAVRPGGTGEGAVMLGGQGSFTAGFAVWPGRRFGVVVCTNAGDSDEVCIEAIQALRRAFASDLPDAPPRGAGPGSGPRLGIVLRGEEGGRLLIDSVAPGSLAESVGLKAGDEFLSINGQPVADFPPGVPPPALREPGAKLVLRRDGKDVAITLPGPGGKP